MRVLPALRALLSAWKFVAGVGAVALTVLLGVVAFALAAGSDEKAEVARAQAGLGAVPSGEEVPSLRTEHSRSYRQADGSLKTKLGLEAVNYRAADGKWKPVDTTLRRTAAGVENAAGALQVRLPDRAEQSAVRVQRGDAWVSFGLRGANGASALSKNTARYANVLPGVSLKYEMGGSSVKETVVLASAKAPSSYTFDVKAADGLMPKVSPSGEIEFRDAAGRRQLTWAAPWMKDAAGQISRAVKYVVDPAAGGWTVRVVADQRWLHAKDRKFPVEIDPTTYFGVGKVCEIASGSLADTSNCTTSEMSVNVGRENGRVHRALVAFDEGEIRSVIGDDALVTSADFFYYWTTSNPDTVELDVHQLTRSFTPAATWNTYDGTNGWTYGGGDGNPDRESRQTMYSDWVNGWVGLGVGRLVQGWLDGSIENNGIGVIPADDAIDRIDNLDGLGLVIESRAKTGADPRATFEQIQPTATSKAKVNVANGNLVLTETDLTSGTGTGSIAVERTINSLGDLATSTFGSGWVPRYGAETTLWQHWVDRSYILEGPGGLAGRFHRKPDGTYDAPPGWNASLVENNDWTITVTFNDTGEAWDFDTSDPRRLTKITRGSYEIDLTYGDNGIVTLTDSDDNEITYTYDSQTGQLQSVGDGTTSREYTLTDGKLLAIAPANATGVEYAYDPNGRVEQVTYPGGSRLAVAYDPNGRVTSLTQKPDHNSANDLTTTFAYSSPSSPCLGSDFGKTVVTYPNAETRTYCHGRALAVRVASPATSSDVTDPTLSFSGDAWGERAKWHREGNLPLDVFAADSGSGIKKIETKLDGNVLDSHEQTCASGGCTMQRQVVANLAGIGNGVHDVDVTATDHANRSTTSSFDVKVDKVGPTLDVSGSLWTDRGTSFESGARELEATAHDIDSGAVEVRLEIDGNVVGEETDVCVVGGCELSLDASVSATLLAQGEHDVELTATDTAGNAVEQSWTITVAGTDQPAGYPNITLSDDLAGLDGETIDGGTFDLAIAATPGSGEGDRGIAEITVDVDTQEADRWEQACTTACSMTRMYTLDADDLDEGIHHVEVRAADNEGRVSHVGIVVGVDREAPAPPEDVEVARSTDSVRVAWAPSPSTDVDGYAVFRRVGTQSERVTADPVDGVEWLDLDAPASGTVSYVVRAIDANGRESVASNEATVGVAGGAPAPPTDLTTRSIPAGVWLGWRRVADADRYVIERADSPTGPFEHLAAAESAQLVDTAVTQGSTHYYRVRSATESGIIGSPSPAVAAQGFGTDEVPSDIRIVVAGGLADTMRAQQWVSDDAGTLSLSATEREGLAAAPAVTKIEVAVDGEAAGEVTGPCTPVGECSLSGDVVLDLTELSDGPHTVVISAQDEDGGRAETTRELLVDHGPPSDPAGLVGDRAGSSIRLEWDPAPDADVTGYEVSRSSSPSGPWEEISADLVADGEYVDEAAPSSRAVYRVRAVDLSGKRSAGSSTVDMEPGAAPPAPQSLQAQSAFRAVNLAWATSTAPVTQYLIYRRSGAGAWSRVATVPGGSVTYSDSTVRPDTEYEYEIRAVDDLGRRSEASNSASATADFGDSMPQLQLTGSLVDKQGTWLTSGIETITATATETGTLNPTPGIVEVAVSLNDDEIGMNAAPCPLGGCALATTASLDISNLADGVHYVQVIARDAAGRETQSQVEVKIDRGPPAAPTGLKTEDMGTSVRVSWDPVAETEARYVVERATTRSGPYVQVASGVENPEIVDSGANAGTRYWYRAAAVDAANHTGPFSTAVSGQRSTAAGTAVSGVTADGGLAHVAVRWDPSTAPDLAGYRVYVGEDPDEDLVVTSGLLRGTLYTDADAEPGIRRYYEVRAVSSAGKTGPPSERVMASAEDLPEPTTPRPLAYTAAPTVGDGWHAYLGTESSLPSSAVRACTPGEDCVFGPVALSGSASQLAYGDLTGALRADTSGGVSDLLCGPVFGLRPSPIGCDGAAPAVLAPDEAHMSASPEFTPDGDHIYFSSLKSSSTGHHYRIDRIPVGGGTPETVLPATDTQGYTAPAVTADGRYMYALRLDLDPVYHNPSATTPVRRDLATGATRALDFDVDQIYAIRPSPTGGRVALVALAPGSSTVRLYTAPANGGAATLVASLAAPTSPTWSPDGRYLLFDRVHQPVDPEVAERDIVRLRVATGETEVLGTVPIRGYQQSSSFPTYSRAVAPELDLGLTDGKRFSNGNSATTLEATAEAPSQGVRAMALVAGDESDQTSTCDSSCPATREMSLTVPVDEYDEGTYPIAGVAQSQPGTPARMTGALVVDRTKPRVRFEATLGSGGGLYIDPTATGDPALADGSPGSGIDEMSYRVKTGGSWSSWTELPSSGAALSGMSGASDVRVRVVDKAGHAASVDRPVFEPGPTAPCAHNHQLTTGDGRSRTKRGVERNVRIVGQFNIVCPKKYRWRTTHSLNLLDGSGLEKPDLGPDPVNDDDDNRIVMDCTPIHRRYISVVVGTGSRKVGLFSWETVKLTTVATNLNAEPITCNMDGMWRVRAASQVRTPSQQPSTALEEGLVAAGEAKPGSDYQAHHIIPASDTTRGYPAVQAIGYRCRIRPNSPANGVWMHQKQHWRTHNKVNSAWLERELRKATRDPNRPDEDNGYCDYARARKILKDIRRQMQPDHGYPGRR